MKRASRGGFSLLEVVLATAVLLGCVIVLSHIAFVGRSHMESADQLSIAQLVCQTRLNEMLSGAAPIQPVGGEPIAELPGWTLSVKASAASQPGLVELRVTAAKVAPAAGQGTAAAGKQFTLVRWIATTAGVDRPGRRIAPPAPRSPGLEQPPDIDMPLPPQIPDQPPISESPIPELPIPGPPLDDLEPSGPPFDR